MNKLRFFRGESHCVFFLFLPFSDLSEQSFMCADLWDALSQRGSYVAATTTVSKQMDGPFYTGKEKEYRHLPHRAIANKTFCKKLTKASAPCFLVPFPRATWQKMTVTYVENRLPVLAATGSATDFRILFMKATTASGVLQMIFLPSVKTLSHGNSCVRIG